jgi:hypothetical protein
MWPTFFNMWKDYPQRKQWQRKLHQDLQTFFHHFPTRPALQDILIDGLRQWFSSEFVTIQGYPALYQHLIINQTSVGWNQLLYGRFVTDWIALQEEFLKSCPRRKKKQSGSTWVSGIVSIIWKNIYSEWENRNKARHGHDKTTKETALIEQAQRETAELYAIREELPQEHRDVFYETLEEHFEQEQSSIGLRQWINTWGSYLLRLHKELTKNNETNSNN